MEKVNTNKLICFGYLSDKICYLNMTYYDAAVQYAKDTDCTFDEMFDLLNKGDVDIKVVNFDNSFCAYDVWEKI